MFIQITLAGSKFSCGTLPTMHSIYVYTDIYQGLKIFANSYIYIYNLYMPLHEDNNFVVVHRYDMDPNMDLLSFVSSTSSDMDISKSDPSATLTAIFESSGLTTSETSQGTNVGGIAGGDATMSAVEGEMSQVNAVNEGQKESDGNDIKQKVKEEVLTSTTPPEYLIPFVNMYNRERVIVDVENICDLLSRNCQIKGCSGEPSLNNVKAEGGVLAVSWKCSGGHSGVWHSSALLGTRRGQNVFVSTVVTAAGVLVSGNNFEKIQMLMKFCSIHFVSESTFNRIQSLCVVPAIKELWERMKQKIWDVLKDTPLVLSGDGRNDSPGHSAKYSVYTIMEHFLDVIIDVAIVDVRESGGVSSTMERLGLRRLMERMMKEIIITETVTDASAMIIKLLRDLKGTCTFHYDHYAYFSLDSCTRSEF